MPSQVSAVTYEQIVPTVMDFAAKCGHNITGSGIITLPGGLAFGLAELGKGLAWGCQDPDYVFGASCDYPISQFDGSAGAPGFQKIFMFSSKAGDPNPYLALVLQWGFNRYRHLYLGQIRKQGQYGGGEIIAGTTSQPAVFGTITVYNDGRNQFLFNGFSSRYRGLKGSAGFVRVAHDANASPARVFAGTPDVPLPTNFACGGFSDAIDDYLMARGRNRYAQGALLVPINLYIGQPNDELCPIGSPPGVASVNLADLQPEQIVNYGTVNWQVFPQFVRNTEAVYPVPNTMPYVRENSYLCGLAYPADGAP